MASSRSHYINKVRFKTIVADNVIDLESGFLMLPQAIPKTPAVAGGTTHVVVTGGVEAGTGGGTTIPTRATVPGVTVPPAKPVTDKTVDITFSTYRNGLGLERYRQPRRHGGERAGDGPRGVREGIREVQAAERRHGTAPRGGPDRVIPVNLHRDFSWTKQKLLIAILSK